MLEGQFLERTNPQQQFEGGEDTTNAWLKLTQQRNHENSRQSRVPRLRRSRRRLNSSDNILLIWRKPKV